MLLRQHNIGVDANRPILIEPGQFQGALAGTVANPDLIAGSGAAWVRLNFVLGPWHSPSDQTHFQGRTWAQAYNTIIHQFRARGLNVIGLISQEAVRTDVDHRLASIFRKAEPATDGDDKAAAQRWIAHYAANFGQIVNEFHQQIQYFESFNEPDDWHGSNVEWIHASWFATMLQAVHEQVKNVLGLHQVKLISGPLQGMEDHGDGSHAREYLRQTYEFGRGRFGWGVTAPYPFDGVGYHLYLKPGFNANWEDHVHAVRNACKVYVDNLMETVRQFEGSNTRKKIFLSEVGWTSGNNDASHLEFQAKNVALALATLDDHPDIDLICWFCTQDFTLPPNNRQYYGLFQEGQLGDGARKPAYHAFKQFCETRSVRGVATFPFTNQTLINAFYTAASQWGEDGWVWIERAGLTYLAEDREAQYAGSAIDLLPELTTDQKAVIRSILPLSTSGNGDATPIALPIRPVLGRLEGKGMYLWQISQCEGGDPQAIAARAKAAQLSHVLIKVADGINAHNIGPGGHDYVVAVTAALYAVGIQAWGWQFVYGDHPRFDLRPEDQAAIAIQRVQQLGLSGFVVDAEGDFEGKPAKARRYMETLRNGLPTLPVALSSFRFVTGHRTFPWEEFLMHCDLHMPQVYWQLQDPAEALARSIHEHMQHTHAKPIVPTGAAYDMEAGVPATAAQIQSFLTAAKANDAILGANFWSWQHAGSERWQAIQNFNW